MDIVANYLQTRLRDAHRPTFCTECNLWSLEALLKLDPAGHTNALFLRQNHHDLLTEIMTFLTTFRSDEDLHTLRDSLLLAASACPCRARHAPSPPYAGDITGNALLALSYPISAALEAAPNLLRTQLFSRKGLWPRSASDLLPRSPKETLRALLGWADRAERSRLWSQSTFASNMLWILLRVCRPELMPELFVHDARLLCIDIMVRQLDAAAAAMRNNDMSESPIVRIEQVVAVFQVISKGVGSLTDDWPIFARDSEQRLIRALDSAWHCVDDTTHHNLKRMLMILQYSLGIMTAGNGLSQPVLDGFRRDVITGANVFGQLCALLGEIHRSVECSYRECKKHARDVEGGRLRKCGSCLLMRYCSRECQKQHWSAEHLPHKLICSDIKELLLLSPLPMSSAAFEATCKESLRSYSFFQGVYAFLSRDNAHKLMLRREERLSGATV